MWTRCLDLPVGMWLAQAVALNDRVYVMGDTPDTELNSTIFISHNLEGLWTQIRCPAGLSALTVFNSQVILVGGRKRTSGEPTRELWSLEDKGKGKWSQPLPAMLTARLGASAVTLNNYLIVAGGRGSGGWYLDAVEVYYTNHWTPICRFPSPSGYMQTVHHDSIFYLVGGGWQGNSIFYSSLQTVIDELSSPSITIWNTLSDTPHQYSSIAICKGTLVAIGGDLTASLHVYCPHTKKWQRMDSEFPEAINGTCSITLPTKQIIVIGGWGSDGRSPRIYKASLK